MYLPVASSSYSTNKPPPGSGNFIPRRYRKLVIYALFIGGCLAVLMLWAFVAENSAVVASTQEKVPEHGTDDPAPKWEIPENPPPDYADYRLNETKYPQHNPDLPFPEGRTGKYVYFSEHMRGTPTQLFALRAVCLS